MLFFGRGAGKLPTASAVVSDIFDIVMHNIVNQSPVYYSLAEASPLKVDISDCRSDFLIRVNPKDRFEAMNDIAALFEKFEFIFPEKAKLGKHISENQLIFFAFGMREKDMVQKIKALEKAGSIHSILGILRAEGEN